VGIDPDAAVTWGAAIGDEGLRAEAMAVIAAPGGE